MIRSVCAVCIGNICRSPLAEAVLADRLPSHDVASAGIGALIGYQADPHAIAVAADVGLDLAAHRARQFGAQHVDAHDLILVMTPTEQKWIARHFPQATGRTFLLGHWRDGVDVPDPYRKPRAAFEEALEQIRELCEDWVSRVA